MITIAVQGPCKDHTVTGQPFSRNVMRRLLFFSDRTVRAMAANRARFFRLRDAAAHRQYANSMATWQEQYADPGRFCMHAERPIVARGIFLALAHRAMVEGRGLIPVALLCLLLAGCGEARLLNPGAQTAYWEVPQSELDDDHPRALSFVQGEFAPHIAMALGDCLRDGSRIRLAFKQEEWMHQHECAHLVDNLGGSAVAARARLGAGCPPCVYAFLDACDAYTGPHRSHWAFQVLQNLYPRDSVIQHPDIIAALRARETP